MLDMSDLATKEIRRWEEWTGAVIATQPPPKLQEPTPLEEQIHKVDTTPPKKRGRPAKHEKKD